MAVGEIFRKLNGPKVSFEFRVSSSGSNDAALNQQILNSEVRNSKLETE